MKIRQGFVSNSSSSSFVIICKPIYDLDDIKKSQIKNGEIWAFGKWLSDAQDVIIIKDQEIFNEIKKIIKNDIYDFKLYNVIKATGEDEFIINKNILPEGNLLVISVCQDYHSTDSIKDLKERYLSEV